MSDIRIWEKLCDMCDSDVRIEILFGGSPEIIMHYPDGSSNVAYWNGHDWNFWEGFNIYSGDIGARDSF